MDTVFIQDKCNSNKGLIDYSIEYTMELSYIGPSASKR